MVSIDNRISNIRRELTKIHDADADIADFRSIGRTLELIEQIIENEKHTQRMSK